MGFGMKETPHSLKLYFGLLGMILFLKIFLLIESIYVKAKDPAAVFSNPGVVAAILTALVFACAYLYIAITLKDLLVVRPNVIRVVITVDLVSTTLLFARNLQKQVSSIDMTWFAVEVLICVYLLINVNRLVREQRE